MKQVYNTHEIAHLFMSDKTSARNSNTSFSFETILSDNIKILRSYHTVIAVSFYDKLHQVRLGTFYSSYRYSVTTAKQQGLLKNAMHGHQFCYDLFMHEIPSRIASIGDIDQFRAKYQDILSGEIEKNHVELFGRAKSENKKRAIYYLIIKQIGDYLGMDTNSIKIPEVAQNYFKFNTSLPLSFDDFCAQYEIKILKSSTTRDNSKTIEQRTEELRAKLERWKIGKIQKIQNNFNQFPVVLRLRDGQIETSHGAKVPEQDSRDFLKIALDKISVDIKIARLCGKRVGNFEVNHFDDNGVKIGCHVINMSELIRINDVLNTKKEGK